MKFNNFIKKNKILLIIFGILCLIVIILLIRNILGNSNNNIKNSKSSIPNMEAFKEKLENKNDMLIYVTDNECGLCDFTNEMIDYYKDAYNLKFYNINLDNFKNKEINEYFNLADAAIEVPSVIYIKNGLLNGIANKILTEDYFRDYLMDYGFIDKKYYENDYRIDYKGFKELYNKDEKNVILFYNYGDNIYKIGEDKKEEKHMDKIEVRKNLLKLSKENNFKYRVVFYSSFGSDDIYKDIITSLNKKEINGPFIVVIKNNKVLDYVVPKNKTDINNFLKDNKIY